MKQVLLCGLGGQGVVLAGTLLGAAAFAQGLQVTGNSSYGSAARGGQCRSEVVLADGPIAFPYVTNADIMVALSQPAYERYLPWTASPDGLVFYDPAEVDCDGSAAQRHIAVPASASAGESLGTRLGGNIVMLAAVIAFTGIVSVDALEQAVMDGSPARFRELNERAVDLGFALGSNLHFP